MLEVEPITVARLIDRLEARGMVERRPDPKDRRIWRLHLLPAGLPRAARIDRKRRDARTVDRRSRRDDARNDDGSTAEDEDHPEPGGASGAPLLDRSKPKRGRSPDVASHRHCRPGASRHRGPPRTAPDQAALLRPILMLGGIAGVAVGSGAYWLTGGRYVSIDDAYVRAAKETVATDVSGIVPRFRSTRVNASRRARFCCSSIRASSRLRSMAPRPISTGRLRSQRQEDRLSADAARG